ncbi:hypothetical protein GCM10017778_30120 [Streptomyces vinaceus]|nr:hypothetical protein GCM10017778_30120 [Streptomyces vinaceus]
MPGRAAPAPSTAHRSARVQRGTESTADPAGCRPDSAPDGSAFAPGALLTDDSTHGNAARTADRRRSARSKCRESAAARQKRPRPAPEVALAGTEHDGYDVHAHLVDQARGK